MIGSFADLVIAEARAPRWMVGQALGEADLRRRLGINVAGVWNRGSFEIAGPATTIRDHSVLVLTGSRSELDAYDATHAAPVRADGHVVIVGAGRVGRATARCLAAESTSYRVIERDAERIRDPQTYVRGNAADREVLVAAGIERASAVVITTHDDDVNVYLTIYCRRLRPDVQVMARANLDRNVSTLHRAGADFVLSYASTGATAIWNALTRDHVLQLAEGLEVFRVPLPTRLVGRTLAESGIRSELGCNVVAVSGDGVMRTNPEPFVPLVEGTELVLIGDTDAEDRFLSWAGNGRAGP